MREELACKLLQKMITYETLRPKYLYTDCITHWKSITLKALHGFYDFWNLWR